MCFPYLSCLTYVLLIGGFGLKDYEQFVRTAY
jgi:hypothetical protein